MFFRLLMFLACLLGGGLLGDVLTLQWHVSHGPLLGVVLAALLWFALDAVRAGRLLRSLRLDSLREFVPIGGLWGEVADRARRLMRMRDGVITESQARLQDFLSALQASPNGVLLLDKNACIEWCNQTAATHFGLDAKRDVLQAIGNLVRDPGFARYLANRNFQAGLTMPGRGNSPSSLVTLSVQLHPYGEGRMLLLSIDITAREQAEAMRRDFVANVSHEIRTPLTVLSGFIETLQTLNLSESERQQYLQLMAQQADRMQTLVSDLLMLSRLEGSPPPALDAWTPMPQLMRQITQDGASLSSVLAAADDAPHQLVVECGFDGQIAGAASELISAMGNLVSNAIRYTPAGGRIIVSAQSLADGGVQFSVEDTGPGIAPEHLGRLTERFYRVDRSRSRETGGTGLGLAIVKHVTQRHGALLSIESTPGKGSVFRITFRADHVKPAGQPG